MLVLSFVQVPSKLKEVLRTHLEHVEQRVHDQQRKLVLMRRESRAKVCMCEGRGGEGMG